MKKRILAAALSLCMIVTLLPISVFAAGDNPAEESWALPAVNTLNTLYKTDVFTASGEVMTETEVQAVLAVMGNENYSGLGTGDLTRSGACEVLTDIFRLPAGEGDDAALNYLFEQNIINGRASGDLAPTDTVTKAEFAVLTYRVLNFAGGGDGSGDENLKPGTAEHFSWAVS